MILAYRRNLGTIRPTCNNDVTADVRTMHLFRMPPRIDSFPVYARIKDIDKDRSCVLQLISPIRDTFRESTSEVCMRRVLLSLLVLPVLFSFLTTPAFTAETTAAPAATAGKSVSPSAPTASTAAAYRLVRNAGAEIARVAEALKTSPPARSR